MRFTKLLSHVTSEGMIVASQPMCAVWEGVPTRAMFMYFSLCCEVVSRLQFGALGALEGGAGIKHGVVEV